MSGCSFVAWRWSACMIPASCRSTSYLIILFSSTFYQLVVQSQINNTTLNNLVDVDGGKSCCLSKSEFKLNKSQWICSSRWHGSSVRHWLGDISQILLCSSTGSLIKIRHQNPSQKRTLQLHIVVQFFSWSKFIGNTLLMLCLSDPLNSVTSLYFWRYICFSYFYKQNCRQMFVLPAKKLEYTQHIKEKERTINTHWYMHFCFLSICIFFFCFLSYISFPQKSRLKKTLSHTWLPSFQGEEETLLFQKGCSFNIRFSDLRLCQIVECCTCGIFQQFIQWLE